jgi:hypothetical protein
VRIVRLAHEIERIAGCEPFDETLAPFETDADHLRVEVVRFTDRRKPVALEIRRAIREESGEELRVGVRVGLRVGRISAESARRRTFAAGTTARGPARPLGAARRYGVRRFIVARLADRIVLVVETREEPLEGGFGGGRRREPAGPTRA